MIRYQKAILVLLASLFIVLSACADVLSEEGVTTLPQAVVDGLVSEEYYLELNTFLDEALPLADEMFDMGLGLILNDYSLSDKQFRQRVESYLVDQKEIPSKYKGNPSTELEEEIDELIVGYLRATELSDGALKEALDAYNYVLFRNKPHLRYVAGNNISELKMLLLDNKLRWKN